MRFLGVILRLIIGFAALGFGIYRFRYIQADWRSALIIAIGIWFVFRALQTARAKPSSSPSSSPRP